MLSLRVLSAGAAKGLVQALAGPFQADTGVRIEATFDSAGAIRSAFADAAGADVVILPAAMLDALASHRLDATSVAALGWVPTGIAVGTGSPFPEVGNSAELRACLAGAPALYCPDTVRSTAGIHFAGVLRTLGISEAKLRTWPNGALAMAALAADGLAGAIGCTQITEILYTPGVMLVAPLPAPFALATVYSAALGHPTRDDDVARRFIDALAGEASSALRVAAGFDAAAVTAIPRREA